MPFSVPYPAHRHFVALPLFGLMLAGIAAGNTALVAGAESLRLTPPQEIHALEATAFLLPGGVSGALQKGGAMTLDHGGLDATLVHGETVLNVGGYLRLQVAEAVAQILHGGAYVYADDNRITIAAIDAPVIVEWQSHEYVLAAGQQWNLATGAEPQRSSIPSVWLRPKREAIAGMTPPVVDIDQIQIGSPMRSLLKSLHSGGAAEARQAVAEMKPTAADARALTAVLLAGDRVLSPDESGLAVDMLSRRTDTRSLLQLFALRTGMGRLVPVEAESSMATVLFGPEDPGMEWVLALASGVGIDTRPVPDAYVQAWETAAEHSVSGDAMLALPKILSVTATLPLSLENNGYPRQAMLWRDALKRLLDFGMPLLPADQRQALTSVADQAVRDAVLQSIAATAERDAAEAAVEAARPHRPDDGYSASRIKDLRMLLFGKGAMYTAGTVMTPLTDDAMSIRVSGIYFATAAGDQSFDFVIDTVDLTVRDIVRDGKTLPNTMPLDQFAASLR